MDINGDNVKRLTEIRSHSKLYLTFGPISNEVVFSQKEGGLIIYYIVNINSGEITRLD